MSATKLTPGKHVVVTDFDGGEGILVDLNTKKYYQLNETAMVVWKGLEKGKTLSEIVADITSSYEVAPEQATLSVFPLRAFTEVTAEPVAGFVTGVVEGSFLLPRERTDRGVGFEEAFDEFPVVGIQL